MTNHEEIDNELRLPWRIIPKHEGGKLFDIVNCDNRTVCGLFREDMARHIAVCANAGADVPHDELVDYERVLRSLKNDKAEFLELIGKMYTKLCGAETDAEGDELKACVYRMNEIATLTAENAKLREALQRCEWNGGDVKCTPTGAWVGTCPMCACFEVDGHAVGCSLAEALAMKGGV